MKIFDSESMLYYVKALKNAWIACRLIKNFPRFIANRLGVINEKETVYNFRDKMAVKIRNRTTDFLILREVLGENDYFIRDLK